jgi:transposase InsO family protein
MSRSSQPRWMTNDAPRLPMSVLDRPFAANAPNRVWTGDITYIATAEGWLYPAVVRWKTKFVGQLSLWRLRSGELSRSAAANRMLIASCLGGISQGARE